MRRSVLFILIFTVLWIFIPMVGCSGEDPTLCECVGECACEGACSCGNADDDADNGEGDVTGPDDEEREAWNPEILGKWRKPVNNQSYTSRDVFTIDWIEVDFVDEKSLSVNYGVAENQIPEEGTAGSYFYSMTASKLRIHDWESSECIAEFDYEIKEGVLTLLLRKGLRFPTFSVPNYIFAYVAPIEDRFARIDLQSSLPAHSSSVPNDDSENPLLGIWCTGLFLEHYSHGYYYGIEQLNLVFESDYEVYCMMVEVSYSPDSEKYNYLHTGIGKRYKYSLENDTLKIFDKNTYEVISELVCILEKGQSFWWRHIKGERFPFSEKIDGITGKPQYDNVGVRFMKLPNSN